ncbi:THO complex subunit 1 [Vitis vinifera]|uniref:THO complex subunit 1 n=1 Tax=Vitis vinifera TaxID=29760 RepID=A0A438IJQ6_VITVI|nr:THO complex subunit 1 [Vitis vinifera]
MFCLFMMQVYCWKGLRFAARQDLDGFSRFTEYGIEGVVPLELLPSDVRSKYQAKPSDRSKRAKKEETKGAAQQAEENQVFLAVLSFPMYFNLLRERERERGEKPYSHSL